MKNTNFEHVHGIAKTLEAIADGNLFKCPECGEWISESDSEYNEQHDIITCCRCGAEFNSEDTDPVSMGDYFSDCLDIMYYSRGRNIDDYAGVRVLVACGGPDIFIDTRKAKVELFWWGEHAEYDLFCAWAIDELFEEFWRWG